MNGMLVHRRVTPSIKFAGTHLYTWVERGTVRVKCLAQEHNTMCPARARTRTARSGDERTNHEATAPPCVVYTKTILLIIAVSVRVVDIYRAASRLVCLTPEEVVRVRALAGHIVLCSWARHFTLTVPLSTQVYKWVPANLNIPIRLMLQKPG